MSAAITRDPAQVAALHQQAADTQQLLVDRLRQLLVVEEHRLGVLRRRVAQLSGDFTVPAPRQATR